MKQSTSQGISKVIVILLGLVLMVAGSFLGCLVLSSEYLMEQWWAYPTFVASLCVFCLGVFFVAEDFSTTEEE